MARHSPGRHGAGVSPSKRLEPGSEESWQKLVARAQRLEDELEGERASKRLLLLRNDQTMSELQKRLARSEEDRDGLRRLWQSSHARIDEVRRQMALRYTEWDAERHALYQELARLRSSLNGVGVDIAPLQVMTPPRQLRLIESAGGGDDQPPASDACTTAATAAAATDALDDTVSGLAAAAAGCGGDGARSQSGASMPAAPPAAGRRASRSRKNVPVATALGAKPVDGGAPSAAEAPDSEPAGVPTDPIAPPAEVARPVAVSAAATAATAAAASAGAAAATDNFALGFGCGGRAWVPGGSGANPDAAEIDGAANSAEAHRRALVLQQQRDASRATSLRAAVLQWRNLLLASSWCVARRRSRCPRPATCSSHTCALWQARVARGHRRGQSAAAAQRDRAGAAHRRHTRHVADRQLRGGARGRELAGQHTHAGRAGGALRGTRARHSAGVGLWGRRCGRYARAERRGRRRRAVHCVDCRADERRPAPAPRRPEDL